MCGLAEVGTTMVEGRERVVVDVTQARPALPPDEQ